MNKFPSKSQLYEALKKIEVAESARPLDKNADEVDRFKYNLCKEILIYKLDKNLTLDELAYELDIGKTDVSKIINYHISRYTIDKLMRLVLKIRPKAKFGQVA